VKNVNLWCPAMAQIGVDRGFTTAPSITMVP
jgi:hypothetical protein